MICEDLKLAEFMRGELEPTETQGVLSHLEGCQICRERIRVMAVLETRFQQESQFKKPRPRTYLAAAAVLIFSLVPLTYYFTGGPTPLGEGERLTAAEPYPYFPLELRSEATDSNNDRLREMAFEAYVTGDYLKANGILEDLVFSEKDPELTFYLGVTHYLLGNNRQALTRLQEVVKDPRWKAPSHWYMANLLLRDGERNSAIRLLEALRDGGGEFSVESAGLLRVLQP